MPVTSPRFLILARVTRPHGIRGDLRIQIMTRFPERLPELGAVYLGADPEDPATVRKMPVAWARRDNSEYWLLHLEGIDHRDAADAFRNQYVLVSLEDAVPLEEDEIYLFQVIGLEVRTTAGIALGRVQDVIETGANDVYVVQGGPYGEVLIPAIQSVIVDTNVETGILTIRLPAGLVPALDQNQP
jgi:16S rRNA processing protein RimM